MLSNVISSIPGTSVVVSATAASVGTTISCEGCDAILVTNTSTTLYVAVRRGTGAQTAVLTTDAIIPPFGQIVMSVNDRVDNVAAIGSGAGPTIVGFTPIRRGQAI